jgi:hypothetical protein
MFIESKQPTNPKLRRSGMKALTTRLSASKGACRPAGAWKYPDDVARYKHVAPLALMFKARSPDSVTGQGRGEEEHKGGRNGERSTLNAQRSTSNVQRPTSNV